jgi:hypothetical protein
MGIRDEGLLLARPAAVTPAGAHHAHIAATTSRLAGIVLARHTHRALLWGRLTLFHVAHHPLFMPAATTATFASHFL